jgi:hypothetical protein
MGDYKFKPVLLGSPSVSIDRYGWDASLHPRGQPDNKGKFVDKNDHASILNDLAEQIESGKLSKTAAGKKLDEMGLKALRPDIKSVLNQRERERKPGVEFDSVESQEETPETEMIFDEQSEQLVEDDTVEDAEDVGESVIRSPQQIASLIAARAQEYQSKNDLVESYRSHLGVRAASELRNKIEATEQAQEAHRMLLSDGWMPESMTSSGSVYYQKGSRKLRISDHEVPETNERKHNSSLGGFSWATDGEQLILPVDDLHQKIWDLR